MAVLNNLIVHGSSRFLNIAQFNALKANTIGADKGVFNKLIATDATFDNLNVQDLTAQNATVVGLLDVQGDMHTNSWSNSNIATIDGSFYITPTAVSADGADVTVSGYAPTGTITYSNTNYTQMTITGTFDTSQLTLDSTSSIAWPANSYVIITGDVLVGTEWYPLGTIRGKLSGQVAANTSSKTFTIIPIGTQIISGESGNVSLTDGNGHKPSTLEAIRLAGATLNSLKLRKVKISMTSRGNGSDQYALGIYMTAMGGNKKTFLDIYGGNNKNGVDISSTISGTTYQSGAFAKPTVRIGNLLGLPPFTLPNNTSVTPTGWGIYTNNGFFSGTIVSTQGKIGNFTLGTAIYGAASGAGPSSISATTAGTYLGTDGFRSNKSGDTTKYVQITDGIITAKGADITGIVNATSFSAKYYDSNNILQRQIALDAFGLKIMDGTSPTPNILSQFGTTSTIGRDNGNNYNINITGNAIDLRYNTNVLNRINSDGMTLYDGQGTTDYNKIAEFIGNNIILGYQARAGYFTTINTQGLQIKKNVLNEINLTSVISSDVASFGNNIILGNSNESHIVIDKVSYKQYGKNEADPYVLLEDLRSDEFPYLAYIKENFEIPGSTNYITVEYEIVISAYENGSSWRVPPVVKKNDTELTFETDFSFDSSLPKKITFTNSLNEGDIIEVTYYTASSLVKAFTFGNRKAGSSKGGLSFAEGYLVEASGNFSHAEGLNTTALGSYSHAEGNETKASGENSHAEGYYSIASGTVSHAEGYSTASGPFSHAEGYRNSIANGFGCHAEGSETIASFYYSHAEGQGSKAIGFCSHAEGAGTEANGECSHTEGEATIANGRYSHAGGERTITQEDHTTVVGRYNVDNLQIDTFEGDGSTRIFYTTGIIAKIISVQIDGATYYSFTNDSNSVIFKYTPSSGKEIKIKYLKASNAFVIGNGTAEDARSNALTVDWEGRLRINNMPAGLSEAYIQMRHTALDSDGTAPEATTYGGNLYAYDVDNTRIGHFECYHDTNGNVGTNIGSSRMVNGSMVYNSISARVTPSGARTYSVTDAAAFRKAINIYSTYTFYTASAMNQTIGATTNKTITITIPAATMSGKTILAVRGWNFNNSSSGGQNCSVCVPYSCIATGSTVTLEIRNNASSQAKIDIYVYCVLVENNA